MKTNLTIAMLLTAGVSLAQVVIPDGTKIRVHEGEGKDGDAMEELRRRAGARQPLGFAGGCQAPLDPVPPAR